MRRRVNTNLTVYLVKELPVPSFDENNILHKKIVKNSPMLILDDLGVERDSAWSQERLYQIIVYRQNYNLPTVITTRTDFPHEAKQGSAIASRIQDSSSGQVLNIDASDFRLSVQ